MSSPLPPDIPGYRIVRVLGQGGMATVYLAVQESLGREVALKLLAPRLAQDPGAAERFMREARTAARLVHRHIVGIHEVGIHEGQPYLAMEFLPGDTLPAGAISPAEALAAARDIALALGHAHTQGVIHRDIKPENILRRADGSAALADFGIARTTDAGSAMTQEGITLGTPHYMSPEQLQGKALDGRSDLYSLGVLLFQLLSGHLPYQGTDGWSIGMQHISGPLPRLPDALSRYQPLVDALMAKDPNQRPQDGAAAARMLDAALAGTTPAATVALALAPIKARTRAPLYALIAVLALSVGGWFAWKHSQPDLGKSAAVADATAAQAAQSDRSIAVLPLANLSGKAENEYFSDGLAETTLDMLARVPDLRVIARSSSFAFKGKEMDARDIGKALGVAHLLSGSVQQSGDQVRITVQLVRSSDGANLWSNKYDRKLADVFKIQDEVATEVVTALQGALAQDDRRRLTTRRTENVAAYQEYLKGNALLPLRRVDDLRAALAHFQRAIRIDPDYARAHAGAANALLLLKSHASLGPDQYKELEEHIRRALALDPELGEAHVAQAGSLQSSDPVAADRAFQRGLQMAPNYATGWQWYAEFLAYDRGQPERAVPMLQKAVKLDPLAPVIRSELASIYLGTGKIAEAERICDELIANYPQFAPGYALKANIARMRNDLVGTLRAADQRIAADPSSIRARGERCMILLAAGALAESKACANALDGLVGHEDWRPDFDFLMALLERDFKRAQRAVESQAHPAPWQTALMLRQSGKNSEALEIYRTAFPALLAQPLGKPELANLFDADDVASALLGLGRREQAQALLRFAIAETLDRPRPGNAGVGFSRVYAYTLLGEYDKACADLDAAASEGFFAQHPVLLADRDLIDLRKQPCFAPAYARIKAVADRQLGLARAAGLL